MHLGEAMRSMLAFIITPTCLYFFEQKEIWIHHKIDGEDKLVIKDDDIMEDFLIKVERILNIDDFSNFSIQLILSHDDRSLVKNVISQGLTGLLKRSCQSWQVFDLSLLSHSVEKSFGHPFDIANLVHIQQYLLPALTQTLYASYTKDSIITKNNILENQQIEEIKSSALQLLDDRKDLEYEVLSLQKQISVLENIDIAHLYSFMPLFYENFFTKVKPSDLSLLASTIAVIHIPSPFPEPDANTIYGLKDKFKQLPSDVQIKITDFAKRFRKTHDLSIRKEMRNYIYEA